MVEAGKEVCYAFTNAASSTPALPGRNDVMLTVAHRPGQRDAVVLVADLPYPQAAEVPVQVDETRLLFYSSGEFAFARDEESVLAAFKGGLEAVARSPRKDGPPVLDTFSLRGFTAAYRHISAACPPG